MRPFRVEARLDSTIQQPKDLLVHLLHHRGHPEHDVLLLDGGLVHHREEVRVEVQRGHLDLQRQ